jgi:hypothetical protein
LVAIVPVPAASSVERPEEAYSVRRPSAGQNALRTEPLRVPRPA